MSNNKNPTVLCICLVLETIFFVFDVFDFLSMPNTYIKLIEYVLFLAIAVIALCSQNKTSSLNEELENTKKEVANLKTELNNSDKKPLLKQIDDLKSKNEYLIKLIIEIDRHFPIDYTLGFNSNLVKAIKNIVKYKRVIICSSREKKK